MLLEQTLEKLSQMKLRGMISALEQWREGGMKNLEAADLIGLLTDALDQLVSMVLYRSTQTRFIAFITAVTGSLLKGQ